MKRFAQLYETVDATTSTSEKVAALVDYLREVPADDAAWAIAFLLGRRPKRLVKSPDLRTWAAAAAGVPDWLFEASYAQAGDLAETITLLVPESREEVVGAFATWVESRLLPLGAMAPEEQREALMAAWRELSGASRFVFNKLITGAFRVGVSEGLVVKALAQVSGLPAETIAHRLMGEWRASAAWYASLIAADTTDSDWSRPYPFFLAHALPGAPDALGDREAWQAEWKWDGIRCQLVKRHGRVFLWSRGEELLAGRFPEIETAAATLPDGTVLDGELLAWRDGQPLPFSSLQRRITRKTVGKKLLAEVPCHLLVYDCLELSGTDIRGDPLDTRRQRALAVVTALPASAALSMSPIIEATSWEALATARSTARIMGAEGLMLKRRDSAYGVGRRTGAWWKWKVDPLTVDAVLVYAQAGHGRRAGLYTDFTLAVHDGEALVPFAKAYSGLSDAELRAVDRWIRQHVREKFGPVVTVDPELVFELAFEGIQPSTRHKSGLAVRFPRISRWRRDKTAAEADTLAMVQQLAAMTQAGGISAPERKRSSSRQVKSASAE